MAKSKYLNAPIASEQMPPGIPYIVCNEAAERFSYYGMRGILVIFMTKYLVDHQGNPDYMSDKAATAYFHYFSAAVYFTPLIGAFLSDVLLGKYRTILSLSILYCLGHLALALDNTRIGLAIGLALIAAGAGGIKPCVSAHVGDQFGKSNEHLLPRVMSWFYFSINLGAFASSLLTPYLLDRLGPYWGPHIAFGVPGALMLVATIVFWMGRYKFVHIPPAGADFLKESLSREGLDVLRRLAVIYFIFIALFWSLYDQTGSAWVLQAVHMDRSFDISFLTGPLSNLMPQLSQYEVITLLPSQVQAVNPLLVLILIPTFSYGLYPLMGKFFKVTPLRKMSIGFFLTVASFALCAIIEEWIQHEQNPHIGWQLLSYFFLTSGEVMVSITGLEFSYTQAPKTMKSVIMALWFLAVAIGNLFTGLVNQLIIILKDKYKVEWLDGAGYYWFFTILMTIAAVAFVFVAANYRGKTYIQDEIPPEAAEQQS